MTSTLTVSTLTSMDRCDRCGAQAYVRVTLLSGADLLFCGHHAREHGDRLRALDATIYDETSRLDETSATAALDER